MQLHDKPLLEFPMIGTRFEDGCSFLFDGKAACSMPKCQKGRSVGAVASDRSCRERLHLQTRKKSAHLQERIHCETVFGISPGRQC